MKKLKIGDRVEHAVYGKGTTVPSSIPGEDSEVLFDNLDNLPILLTEVDVKSLIKIKEV